MTFIQNGAIWNAGTRELQVSAMATFQQTVTGNYKMAIVLTEDGVTGTTTDYAQANAYAGGANGDMGGYETLPSPVPASQMVYDHVARAITPSFNGLNNAFTGAQNAGNATAYNTTFTLPAEWDENNVHIIAMVIAPDGTIDNAESVSIAQGVQNGYIAGLILGQNEIVESTFEKQIQLYPNPATDNSFINLNLTNNEKVTVMSADGRIVADKSYGELNGSMRLPINLSGLSNGIYLVKVMIGDQLTTMTLVKE
jgi:Outer membrane protein Omp28/Secretion system C-terminal sorting domain